MVISKETLDHVRCAGNFYTNFFFVCTLRSTSYETMDGFLNSFVRIGQCIVYAHASGKPLARARRGDFFV